MPTKKNTAKTKKVVVNRKFLTDLANSIYNPKTKTFLRLCDGKLQNGPDPTDESRPMHCGLGELYFAMTGMQPHDGDVSEADVVDLAVERSKAFKNSAVVQQKTAFAQVKKLNLPETVVEALEEALDNLDVEDFASSKEKAFREVLINIPEENDDGCGNACTDAKFRARSKRVADQLRQAAKLLPA